MLIRRAYFSSLLAGVLATFAFMIHVGDPARPRWWLGMLPFALWASVPFVGMAIAARAFHDSSRSMAVLWLGALAIVVGSVALYFQTFVFDLDAQGGIVFAMLPFLQMLAFLPFLGLAVLLRSHRMAPGNRHQS